MRVAFGFTLIEVLVVLIVVAAVGYFVWPLISGTPEPEPAVQAVDLTVLPASADPANDCPQAEDMRLKISGCTAYLDDAAASQAQRAEAHDHRGTAFAALMHMDRARADYDEAIRLEPAFPRAYLNRGYLNEFEKKFAAAESDYQRALSLAEQRQRASPSDDLRAWITFVRRSVERIADRRVMERRWADYLAQIQAQDDYRNWPEKPHDMWRQQTAE